MRRNVGTIDRIVRMAAGSALIGLAYGGAVGAWGYLGAVPLLTGILGSCPAYAILGISTCRKEA